MNAPDVACRLCGSHTLIAVLTLGQQPLANQLVDTAGAAVAAKRFPLEVAFCPDCALLQITESVPPQDLFSDYLYFSSFSETMLRHAETIVEQLIRTRQLTAQHRVVEIASNDGYLLQYYRQHNIPVLGIEPAANVAAAARSERDIETLCEFFTADLAKKLAADGLCADVIHANNVLAHVPDLNGFADGLYTLLKPHGVAVIEVPYVKDLMDGCEFDTIYHEHLSYFALTPLNEMFSRHGLSIVDVEHLSMHGGSLRLFVQRKETATPNSSAAELLERERGWGVGEIGTYRAFAERVEASRNDLCALLNRCRAEGKRVAAYGAAAKGSTLLNYYGIGSDTIEFVADRSHHKQGKFMPGTGVPIVGPEALLESKPDYVLLLVWNFAEEVLRQQQTYRDGGGKFILPIPKLRIV